MKKAIITVITIGILAVSCGGGGGNIKKVQNGVFSNYDNTITVGKAIENNRILKGGKWDTLQKDGRDYVIYTVRMTGEQVRALLPESLSSTESYRNKPNLGTASSFYGNLAFWTRNTGYAEIQTSMSVEEIRQVHNILEAYFDSYNQQPNVDNFFDTSGIIESFNAYGPYKMHDDFIDPYLQTIMGKVTDLSFRMLGVINSYTLNEQISRIVTDDIWQFVNPPSLQIENGRLTGEAGSLFRRSFTDTNYADNTDLMDALVRTRTKFFDWFIKSLEEYDKAKAVYQERQRNDIEPLITIDGHEIILSFVMNQDDTFTTNMMESYTEVTLNCFNNLKVRYNAVNTENPESILNNIYRGFIPDFF